MKIFYNNVHSVKPDFNALYNCDELCFILLNECIVAMSVDMSAKACHWILQ